MSNQSELDNLNALRASILEETGVLYELRRQIEHMDSFGHEGLAAQMSLLRHRTQDQQRDAIRRWKRPSIQPYGVSHEGAELLARDWMRFLGIGDAEVTRFSADGGIDVTSATHVAQVKNYAGSIGVEPLRQLVGVASVDAKIPLFFGSGQYTADAKIFAERADLAVFNYNPAKATLHARTPAATAMVKLADPVRFAFRGSA